jgi:WD40 repeat protein
VAFLPDGSGLVSGGEDATVLRWRFGDGGVEGPELLGDAGGPVDGLAVSPDGKRLASAGRTGVWLWDLTKDPPEKAALPGDGGPFRGAAFVAGGKALLVYGKAAAVLWDVTKDPPEKTAVLTADADELLCVAASPDGKALAAGGKDGSVRLWRMEEGGWAARPPMHGHTGPVAAVAFTPNGRAVLSGGQDRMLRRWDAAEGRAAAEPVVGFVPAEVRDLAVSPDGKTLAVLDAGNRLTWWDVAARVKRGEVTSPLRLYAPAFAPDGRHVAAGAEDGTVSVFRVAPPPAER